METTNKEKGISTSEWHVQHLFTGWNTPQTIIERYKFHIGALLEFFIYFKSKKQENKIHFWSYLGDWWWELKFDDRSKKVKKVKKSKKKVKK